MLIIMRKDATEFQLDGIKQYLSDRDFDFHQSTGANRTILGVIGATSSFDSSELERFDGVHRVYRIPEDDPVA